MVSNLKFIHITKCAGNSIEEFGNKRGLAWGRFHVGVRRHHKILTPEIKSNYDWFMVVRNPYTRILSEYYCKWGGIGAKNIVHDLNEMNSFLIDKINARDLTGDHYTEQYKYLVPNVKILHYETLQQEFTELLRNYNIENSTLEKTNSRPKSAKFTIEDFSEELLSLINEIYDQDFTEFSYKKIDLN